MHLIEWEAKRAGGRITVYGIGRDKGRKIVGVDKIVPKDGACQATDKNGETHTLSV